MTKSLVVLLLAGFAAHAQWKAGVARTDITPTEPVWMAGYSARTKPSEGVRQKIWVKALALEDANGSAAVLVTSDLLGFTRRMALYVADQAKQKYGLTRDRIAINSSHSHSGPVTGTLLRPAYPYDDAHEKVVQRYTARLLDQVVDTIGAALKDRKPATLEYGLGLAGFAANRRRFPMAAKHYPGPVDHDVPVLVVRSEGRPRAIVFGYACHATALSDNLISGDWPGYAQEAIENTHPGATALFVTGAGADANPLPRRTVELAQQYGKQIEEAVAAVMSAKMKPVEGALKTAFDHVDLPFATPPTKAELETRIRTQDGMNRRHTQMLLDQIQREGRLPDRYPYPLQVLQLGPELRMILLGGELVVDYALRLKAQYGWTSTWIAGYSNDVFAYIPSVRVLKEGGYEGGGAMIPYGQPGPFHPAVEETIVDKIRELVDRVR